MAKYQPKEFEEKWQKKWEEEKVYSTHQKPAFAKASAGKDKKYVLAMFPYPSGAGLHVGHVRIYTGTDVLARFFRMQGYPVLHPMGWDAFGLPAENAAVKAKKNPMDLVPKNIENFKRQMKMLGFSYDWNKEFSTTDPSYYKWTQWLFIQFFKMGLLYKKQMPIYYCPSCKTGLAEEEVLPNNTHERCGKEVERRTLPQWVFKITTYADRLLGDLEGLDWPSGILEMQKNWIGKSEGAEIKFKVDEDKFIKVFTTRPDTLYGVTALVVAPEHWIIEEILSQKLIPKLADKSQKLEEIKKYVEEAKKKMDLARTDLTKEKTGVDTGLKAIHPLTGEEIPVWVADYVLGWYGEGAVMVVPAHDERDFEFAKKFGLKIREVVVNKSKVKSQKSKVEVKSEKFFEKAFTEYGVLVNSGEFSGLRSEEAIKKITEKLEKLGLGKKAVTYKLRDWIFSRQRYWGEPIPMVYCQSCADKKISYFDVVGESDKLGQLEIRDSLYGWFPLEEKDLPLKLPYVSSYEPTETGESPLSKIESFVKTTCPNCGGPAKRETDTMPNWAGSCWYFLAFPLWSKGVESQSLAQTSSKRENFDFLIKSYGHWLPVDWYLGGAEHAVLHLLYSRFWVKALYDLGLLNFKEPFLRLRNVGMVLAEDNRKMSKSFGNVINPDDVVSEYGADALRLYEMFMAPFNQEIAWSTKALQGCYRFLKRVWEIYQSQYQEASSKYQEDKNLVSKLNKTIKKVTDDVSQIKFNTAIAAMMEFVNEWEKVLNVKHSMLNVNEAKKFLQILAPFAPFLTEEIWREIFGEKESIHLSSWPKAEVVKDEEVVIPIQVNGKLRGTIKVKIQEIKTKSFIEQEALKDEKIKKYLEGKKYKFIYVEGKVGNFVVEVN